MTDALERLEQHKIVGVLRASGVDQALEQAGAALRGGLKVIELTFTTPGVLEVLVQLKERHASALVGVGTVLHVEHAEAAVAAGAAFLVSPHLDKVLVETSKDLGVPYIPGVLTPSEIQQAQRLGCDLVKLFPIARAGGPAYLKDLRGPFPNLKVMVTGGVSITDVSAYVHAGAQVIGLGSIFAADPVETEVRTHSLFKADAL